MQKIRQENYFKTSFDFFKQNVIQGINKSAAWFQVHFDSRQLGIQ